MFDFTKTKTMTAVSALKKRYRKFVGDKRGVAAIEMAFIFPVMISMLVGLVDVTDGLSASRKVTITANTVGDLVTQENGTTNQANLDGIFAGALETMAPFNGATVGIAVYNYRLDDDDDPQLEWQHSQGPSCGAPPTPTPAMAALMSQGNDLIISRACYNYTYVIGKLFTTTPTIAMNEEMTLRPRKSLQLECTDC